MEFVELKLPNQAMMTINLKAILFVLFGYDPKVRKYFVDVEFDTEKRITLILSTQKEEALSVYLNLVEKLKEEGI